MQPCEFINFQQRMSSSSESKRRPRSKEVTQNTVKEGDEEDENRKALQNHNQKRHIKRNKRRPDQREHSPKHLRKRNANGKHFDYDKKGLNDDYKDEDDNDAAVNGKDDHDDDDDDEDDDDVDVAAKDNDNKIQAISGNSLKADLLNNTKKAEIPMLFFNRVPKVGSQSLMQLMNRLGKVNGFVHSRDQGKAQETILLRPPAQRTLIEELISRPMPHAYSQHIAYINFTRFNMPKPIYINLVRHPIERIISWHYYVRAEWYYIDMQKKLGDRAPKMPSKEFLNLDLDTCVRKKDVHCLFTPGDKGVAAGDHRRQTLFFCGQNKKLCMPFDSEAAMQKAKRTVEQEYAVVGTWEDTNITLTVFEHYIPLFFRNAKVAYHLGKEMLSKVNKNPVKRPVSDLTRQLLAKNLTHEIEFYEFCKQRLYLQYAAINEGRNVDSDDYLLVPEKEEKENKNDDY